MDIDQNRQKEKARGAMSGISAVQNASGTTWDTLHALFLLQRRMTTHAECCKPSSSPDPCCAGFYWRPAMWAFSTCVNDLSSQNSIQVLTINIVSIIYLIQLVQHAPRPQAYKKINHVAYSECLELSC